MSFLKSITAGAVALTLAACAETGSTSLKAAPGQSVDEVARGLTQTRAIALFIAGACRTQGIALRNPDLRAALESDMRNLQSQGYDLVQLKAAFERAGKDPSLTRSAISYLETRGAKRGNIASVCAVGGREIAQKTTVGRLLKRG